MIGMAALLSLTTVAACSETPTPTPSLASTRPTVLNKERAQGEQTVPGSYLVTAKGDGVAGDGEAAIRRVFAQYGVALVSPLGNGQFEVHLERDPGLDALKGLAAGSNGAVTAIQPNYIYRAF